MDRQTDSGFCFVCRSTAAWVQGDGRKELKGQAGLPGCRQRRPEPGKAEDQASPARLAGTLADQHAEGEDHSWPDRLRPGPQHYGSD